MSKFSRMLLVLPVIAALSACTSSKNDGGSNVNAGSVNASSIVQDSNLTSEQKAERLASAAEQLLTSQGFTYADDVVDLALAQNPDNTKAQFLKALLGPIMMQKGIVKRIKPLVALDAKLQEEYDQKVTEIEEQNPNSAYTKFLEDGEEDLRNEADVQAYYDEVAESYGKLREFAKEHKNSEIVLTASESFLDVMRNRYTQACTVIDMGSYNYDIKCPTVKTMYNVKMNRADLEAIQQMAAGYQLAASLSNSYDLTGSIQVALNHRGEASHPGKKQIIDELVQTSEFGLLRNSRAFSQIRDMGLDAVVGARWIVDNQDSLCANGKQSERNRIGYLLNTGICLNQSALEAQKTLKKVEAGLNGGIVDVTVGNMWQSYKTVAQPSILIDSPISDVRQLLPIQVNACDQIVNVADGKVGGLLPNGDAAMVLSSISECYSY